MLRKRPNPAQPPPGVVRLEMSVKDAETLGSTDPTVRAYIDMNIHRAHLADAQALMQSVESDIAALPETHEVYYVRSDDAQA